MDENENAKDGNEKLLKNYWKNGKFLIQDETSSCQEKVMKLRNLMFFIHRYLAIGKLDELSHRLLHEQLAKEYSALLDCMKEGKGLNNYSNEISSRVKDGGRNDSEQWTSSLSVNNMEIKNLIGMQKHKSKQLHLRPYHQSSNGTNKTKEIIDVDSISRVSTKKDIKMAPIFQKHNKRNLNEEESIKSSGTSQIQSVTSSKLFPPRKMSKTQVYPEKENKDSNVSNPFLTAGEQLTINERKKKSYQGKSESYTNNYGASMKKSLGTRRGVHGKFIPPVGQGKNQNGDQNSNVAYGETSSTANKNETLAKYEQYDWMKNIDGKMIELIENEIMDIGAQVTWDDIAGLEYAKNTIQEIVIWPMLRPDIFTGLRGPPKGLLLFGPPGTGKTLIGKCIASQSNATFFSISASSLTSKWVGEGEKMVRALFAVAKCHQPAVIFIDEIDSLLTQRSDTEHESSRRIKTEFLVQLDGATSVSEERILVVGATNRPQELDEAARRRLVKRLYIPLPSHDARQQIVEKLMSQQLNDLSSEDLKVITEKTDGYSGADMTSLCREAALGPIRSIRDIRNVNASEVRAVCYKDFESAIQNVRPSVSKNDLSSYVQWNDMYGCGSVR